MKKIIKWLGIAVAIVALLFVLIIILVPNSNKSFNEGREAGQETSREQKTEISSTKEMANEAINIVANTLRENELGITVDELKTKDNPKGEGVFVYHPETRFYGVERNIIWLVLDNQAFPLNGATKDITPDLLWPREVENDLWNKTGLDKFEATEAIEIVFR